MKKAQGFVAGLRKELLENLRPYFGKMVENRPTGIMAKISRKSVSKMSSDKAINKSKNNGFTVQEHFEAANNILRLYKIARLVEVSSDKNNDINVISIKRFSRDIQLSDGVCANAYITLKETKFAGHKIYSIELMEINKASV